MFEDNRSYCHYCDIHFIQSKEKDAVNQNTIKDSLLKTNRVIFTRYEKFLIMLVIVVSFTPRLEFLPIKEYYLHVIFASTAFGVFFGILNAIARHRLPRIGKGDIILVILIDLAIAFIAGVLFYLALVLVIVPRIQDHWAEYHSLTLNIERPYRYGCKTKVGCCPVSIKIKGGDFKDGRLCVSKVFYDEIRNKESLFVIGKLGFGGLRVETIMSEDKKDLFYISQRSKKEFEEKLSLKKINENL
ncbi:MAG: hypothetical protein ACPHLK_04790 [Gammaproteobacteria bacterium]